MATVLWTHAESNRKETRGDTTRSCGVLCKVEVSSVPTYMIHESCR